MAWYGLVTWPRAQPAGTGPRRPSRTRRMRPMNRTLAALLISALLAFPAGAGPSRLPVTLRSTSGDLDTEQSDGRQELDTTSGEIGVSVAGGAVRASTTSGDIRVSARGAARLRSVSGSLTAEEVGGP